MAANGAIAYTQFRHQTDLYLLSVESGAERRLTANTRDNFAARFLPGGNKVAYHSDRGGNYDIWCLDLDTGEERRLISHPATDIYADFSPDGTSFVFVSNRDGAFRLWLANADGGAVRRLSEQIISMRGNHAHFNRPVGPQWSPDGKLIGYLARTKTGQSFCTVRPDGRGAAPRIDEVETFDWYLGSARAVYTRLARHGTKEMRAVHLETKQEETLLIAPHAELIVAPDGHAVAFCKAQSHVAMDLATLELEVPSDSRGLPRAIGEPRQLTGGEGAWHVHNGGWSPDAKQIVYTRDTDEADIYVIKSVEP